MKKKISPLSWALISAFVLVMAGCTLSEGRKGALKIDMRRSVKAKIQVKELCSAIELIPLENQHDTNFPTYSKLSVTNFGYFCLDNSGNIVYFTNSGKINHGFASTVSSVEDFTIYNDTYIEALSGNTMYELNIHDGSVISNVYISDSLVTLTSIARRAGNVIVATGYNGCSDYFCEYYIDDDKFYRSPGLGDIDCKIIDNILKTSRFFSFGEETFLLYSHTGSIWRIANFCNPKFHWDMEVDSNHNLSFNNAQMAGNNVYLSFSLDKDDYLLILDKFTNKHKISKVGLTSPCFGLGVIKDSCNYFICPSEQLDLYIDKDLLDNSGKVTLDSLNHESICNILIKYHLRS